MPFITLAGTIRHNKTPDDSLRNERGAIVLSTDRFIREKECE
ncbi:AlpA family transcriptional regulator, partial [Escherichia coli]